MKIETMNIDGGEGKASTEEASAAAFALAETWAQHFNALGKLQEK